MFRVRPMHPMIRTSFGCSTRSRDTNLSIDWRNMLIPRASKKTPLKKAPNSWALCHPKDRSWGDSLRSEIWQGVNNLG